MCARIVDSRPWDGLSAHYSIVAKKKNKHSNNAQREKENKKKYRISGKICFALITKLYYRAKLREPFLRQIFAYA